MYTEKKLYALALHINQQQQNHDMKKFSLIAATIIVVCLFLKLYSNYSARFDDVSERQFSGQSVNLLPGFDKEVLQQVLLAHSYVSNKEDAVFATNFLSEKLEENGDLAALYNLNKRAWQVPVQLVDSIGGPAMKEKLKASLERMGMDAAYDSLQRGLWVNKGVQLPQHQGELCVRVQQKEEGAGVVKRLLGLETSDCTGVWVRLSEEYLDSLNNMAPSRATLAYLKTDEDGEVVFSGLDTAKSYSVLPICKGFEYGTSKGTLGGTLHEVGKDGKHECTFTQKEHRLRLFDESTLNQMKADGTVTIRSVKEYKDTILWYVVLTLGAWWALYLVNLFRRKPMDEVLLSLLMLLTGMCLLTMFSLNDPLSDKMLGVEVGNGILAGIVLIFLLQFVNFKRLYQNQSPVPFDFPLAMIRWLFLPFRRKVSKLSAVMSNQGTNVVMKSLALMGVVLCLPCLLLDLIQLPRLCDKVSVWFERLPKGSGYLLSSLLLTLLLFTPLGASVGGMKVNLNIGFTFQPSEIAKYLIIFFLAAYFSVNADTIVKYSARGNTELFASKMKMLLIIVCGLGMLMALYLVLGDMGPSLVLAFTFIITYSLIKSKTDLQGLSDGEQLKRIFTCDLAMLIYGVLSFVGCLLLGMYLDNMLMLAAVWFVVWIVVGVVRKQVFESPVLFNLIISAFIFGSSLLGALPGLDSVAERLDIRNEMCTNTWGQLPIAEPGERVPVADAGENTQVAEGLWALASGGFWGQGLGNGSPSFIPAFHTDMVLESVAEQMGFLGVFAIILLLAMLLRKTIVLGYRTSHPFLFYLCLGIAVVTGIQFLIIALGSTGMIPLTGVTVPFLSFGKVSMILNLVAFGVILSISSHTQEEMQKMSQEVLQMRQQDMRKNNYSVSLLSLLYSGLALAICGVFFYYQVLERDKTLIRPAYVHNSSGAPVLEYNPRIAQLTNKMYPGDIFDRNGVLLATSNKSKLSEHAIAYANSGVRCDTSKVQRRYYPYGEHLYFMLGDFNTKLYFSSSDRWARGYMAEARHLSELRGFDNVKKDNKNKPIRVALKSEEWSPGKFYSKTYEYENSGLQLRDYTALLDYLKKGMYSDVNAKFYDKNSAAWSEGNIRPKDVTLTLDAQLQTRLQQAMEKYAQSNYAGKEWNKLRMSIVVLDGEQGDLLASANYPMVDYDVLRNSPDVYESVEKNQESSWKAYTDMDLGLVRATAPGSTAKVISALAGLRQIGVDAADENNPKYCYNVNKDQIVGIEPIGKVTMRDAIVVSSNCYFINLVNDCDLYDSLAYVYRTVGANIKGQPPYVLDYNQYDPKSQWETRVVEEGPAAVTTYRTYLQEYPKYRDNKMNKHSVWQWAWGQGTMSASPLAMARVVSIVANQGKMPVTRYAMNDTIQCVPVVTAAEAARLNQFMKAEAVKKKFTNDNIGGKTGTAERVDSILVTGRKIQSKKNDGWFICFIENSRVRRNGQIQTVPLAVAVRLERLGNGMSGRAVDVTQDVVLPVLKNLDYIN